jgi:spermidine synthase
MPWLFVLFVCSGCAALIYEVVWLQLLQLVIGLTTISLGLLLGVYMGGMCLGSLWLSRLVSRRHHPLRVYAVLELGIGIIGMAVLYGMPWVGQFYGAEGGPGLWGMLVRGGVAVVCLVPPTLLMGATLPAISRWIEMTPRGVTWLGLLYGGNIAGAVLGCLVSGFYLLRVHNMAVATQVAAAINGTVALLALVLSVLTPKAGPAETATSDPLRVAAGSASVHVAIALSGMAALGAEVVWTRLLSLIMGATVYTFSIILAIFLAGLGLGSGMGAVISRLTARPRWALGVCQLLLLGAVTWTAWVTARSLPFWPVNPALALSPWYVFQMDIARCWWAILPAPILWGASFPLALAAVAGPGQDSGRLVGGLYAANTTGAIVGALAFSLWVIPALGTHVAQKGLVVISLAAALILLAPALAFRPVEAGRGANPNRRGPTLADVLKLALMGGGACLLFWTTPAVPWGVVAYGRYVATYASRLYPDLVAEKDIATCGGRADIFCTYLGEGLNGSVAVTQWKSGVRNFHSAGKVQASTDVTDMRLQRMLGHLAGMIHPRPESVLVVACGAGVTAGTFVLYPSVRRLVICDIEPLVPQQVAPMFEKENYGVVKDPRTRIVLDDGRHFIRTTRERFDIITSDPIDPWVKGCAALNTVDYYEMCKARLNPGGIMALWIPLYESNIDSAKSVIATFFKVFPNGILWSNSNEGEGYDAVLLGQNDAIQIDLDQWQERWSRRDYARVRQSLEQVGFSSPTSLLATYAGCAADLEPWMRDAQINTDANLRLQYLAGLWLNSFQGTQILDEISQYYLFPHRLFVGSPQNVQRLRHALEQPKNQ